MSPGPGSGAPARAMLANRVPYYYVYPETVDEYYEVHVEGRERTVAELCDLSLAVAEAQRWSASTGKACRVIHVSYAVVAVVGEDAPDA